MTSLTFCYYEPGGHGQGEAEGGRAGDDPERVGGHRTTAAGQHIVYDFRSNRLKNQPNRSANAHLVTDQLQVYKKPT